MPICTVIVVIFKFFTEAKFCFETLISRELVPIPTNWLGCKFNQRLLILQITGPRPLVQARGAHDLNPNSEIAFVIFRHMDYYLAYWVYTAMSIPYPKQDTQFDCLCHESFLSRKKTFSKSTSFVGVLKIIFIVKIVKYVSW